MPSTRHKLSAPDWALRISVALVFVLFGMEKLVGDSWVTLFADVGVGQWFRYFTGVVQVTGAALYAIPRTARTGMALLACTMIGAVGVHLFVLHTGVSAALIPAVLLGVVVGGWRRGQSDPSHEFITIRECR
jgi:putative oxidoreductase